MKYLLLALFCCLVVSASPMLRADDTASAGKTITVAADGTGDFKTVQAAINAAPDGSQSRIVIHIKPGTYKELIQVPKTKPNIEFLGDDAANTILTYNNTHNTPGPDGKPMGTSKSASTFIYGPDFLARNITFENSAGPIGQALAIFINGDRAVFLNCRFVGWQDTIKTDRNREYFRDCFIEGHVDFIFGAGTAYFENCELHCRAKGSITAASTLQDSAYGYVFDHCRITSEPDVPAGSVILGRPWRPYGATIFLNTEMSNCIAPRGWDDWGEANQKTARYAEYGSTGAGAATYQRAIWTRQLATADGVKVTVQAVLAGDDQWNPESQLPTTAPSTLPTTVPTAIAPATQPEAELPHFAQPQIPDHIFKLTDFGAVGDGKTMNTAAFTKAIAAIAAAGGGTLDIPAGKFLTAPFVLTDNLNLHLDAGATILFSNDPHDFPLANGGYQACITFKDGHDIAITGNGTIDGQGQPFWQHFKMPKTDSPEDNPWLPKRPKLIMLTRCQRVLVRDVMLQNSPMFHLVPSECREVTIDHIYIHSPVPSPNTDGIDPSGFDIRITNCTIDTGDDCIAVKGGERYDPQQPSCQNIFVANCTFLHGHGMSIGSESYGGVRHMLVSNCTFNGTNAGIRLKSPRGRGGLVEDLVYQNLTMKGVKNSILITSYYPKIPVNVATEKPRPVGEGTPHWRNIEITNVTSAGGQIAGQIVGLPEMPIENLTLTNVHISAGKPIQIVHARNVQFVNSSVSATKGKPIISDADVKGLN